MAFNVGDRMYHRMAAKRDKASNLQAADRFGRLSQVWLSAETGQALKTLTGIKDFRLVVLNITYFSKSHEFVQPGRVFCISHQTDAPVRPNDIRFDD
jgi:hypothetical protein